MVALHFEDGAGACPDFSHFCSSQFLSNHGTTMACGKLSRWHFYLCMAHISFGQSD
ncbi:hypothetical protein C2845_PM16G00060 [Panicum miliaceum]|uniref:Uncharacterized protein n=1 Tax=Panicum miliaceum TaxID=4540 RepID=A0A3L6PZV6_PANMI|nr:hypothetical protein C2845_PM16G00060 [Panicum miliaceum]